MPLTHSWYQASIAAATIHPPLAGNQRADVCVIGGGYTGLSAARNWQWAQSDSAEAEQPGWGCSGAMAARSIPDWPVTTRY